MGGPWRRDSAWGELPPAWLGTFDSLLPQEAGRGAGGLHCRGAGHASSSWERNKPGSHGGGSSRQLPVCRENGTLAPPGTQVGNWGKCPERLCSSVCWACTLPASTSLLADDPTASPGSSALWCCEDIKGKGVQGSEAVGVDGCHRGRCGRARGGGRGLVQGRAWHAAVGRPG